MERKITVYIINGSSLGGGEVDSILRASLNNGFVIHLQKLSRNVKLLCARMNVGILKLSDIYHEEIYRDVVIKTAGFLRDITLLPMILRLALLRKKLPELEVGVHCDPLESPNGAPFKIQVAIFVFQIFCILFASQIRFVSIRQLKSFKALSTLKKNYVDPPCSEITRKHRVTNPDLFRKTQCSISFVGRLSSSTILGDAKNSEFLLRLAKELSCEGMRINVYGGGNQERIINSLDRLESVTLHGEVSGIDKALLETSVLLVPSKHEGYCLVAREAAILGCSVLVTRAVAPEIQTLPRVVVIDNLDTTCWMENIRLCLS